MRHSSSGVLKSFTCIFYWDQNEEGLVKKFVLTTSSLSLKTSLLGWALPFGVYWDTGQHLPCQPGYYLDAQYACKVKKGGQICGIVCNYGNY